MIDSLDRTRFNFANTLLQTQSQTANNFTITAQQPFLYGYFTRLAITQVYLKYRVPTIVATDPSNNIIGNDRFNIFDLGGAGTGGQVNIPQGYYTAAELATQLELSIQALGAPFNTYTVSWNAPTRSFKIDSNSANAFYINNPIAINTDAGYRIAKTLNTLGWTWKNGQAALGGTPGTSQILAPPQLTYTTFVDICSERLTRYQRVKDSETGTSTVQTPRQINFNPQANIVARVYLVAPNTRVVSTTDTDVGVGTGPVDLVVDYNTPKHIRWSPDEAVFQLDFTMYDQYGDPLPWKPDMATEFMFTTVASET